MFTAAVLTKVSQVRLLQEAVKEIEIPGNWEWVCHHMTVHMGRANELDLLGSHVTLIVDAIAIDDKVCAVRISDQGFNDTVNKIPHVTIAVNRDGGGKPVMSNNLNHWKEIKPIVLFAVIEECP